MRLDRDEKTLIPHLGPMSIGNPEHDSLAWAIDVGVENAGPGAEAVEGEREVDCCSGLSDPALAGSDGNNVLRAGDTARFGCAEFEVEDGIFAYPL